MPQQRPYLEVDVFGAEPLAGNPVAVVVDSNGLDTAGMQRFARWTNLSETTFLLPPTDPAADYRVRIFTPARELPFAGHPTLGSAAAWLDAGGVPAASGTVVQECGVGLVTLRNGDGGLAFRAPDLLRSGPVDAETQAQATRSLRLTPDDTVDAAWVDNGPGWLALLLADADTVLGLRPDLVEMGDLRLGVVGPYPHGVGAADVEVRAFVPSVGVGEDPVTGSLNAGIALWLQGSGVLPDRYVAGQGGALGRDGRVTVERRDDGTWVGGATHVVVRGTVEL